MIEDVSPISRKNDLFVANFGGTPCRFKPTNEATFLRFRVHRHMDMREVLELSVKIFQQK